MDAVVLLKMVKVLMEMKHPQNGKERWNVIILCGTQQHAKQCVQAGNQYCSEWWYGEQSKSRNITHIERPAQAMCLPNTRCRPSATYLYLLATIISSINSLLAANWSTILIKYFYYSLELYIMNFLLYKRPCISV